ncbi:hypothetical protein WEI85_43185 [Actinomycetes bacterium KLBMP 9797]
MVFVLWTARPSAADRSVLGGAGSVILVGAALALTVIGTGTAMLSITSLANLRWLVAIAVLVVWGGISILAGGNLFAPDQPADFLIGLLLCGAAIGMGGIATLVLRRPAPPLK